MFSGRLFHKFAIILTVKLYFFSKIIVASRVVDQFQTVSSGYAVFLSFQM